MATLEELQAAAVRRKREALIASRVDGPPEITPEQAQAAVDQKNEFFYGDDDPNTLNAGEYIGTMLNKAGEAMTAGLVGDESSAAIESLIPGVDYETRRDHYRQQERNLERDYPVAALTADIGGAITLPIGVVGRGVSLGKRMLASGLIGGGLSGVYSGMESEGDRIGDAAKGAGIGGAVGAFIPGLGRVAQNVADRAAISGAAKRAARNAPSADDLKRVARDAYNQVDKLGIEITADAFDRTKQKIINELLATTGYTTRPGGRTITPKTSAVIDNMHDISREMAKHKGAALPFREVDSLRRQAGAAAGHITEATDQKAGMTVINGLDDLVDNLTDADVVAGDAESLGPLINKARKFWSKASKTQKIDNAIEAADGIKWQFRNILKSPKKSRGFTEAEKALMKRVIRGTIPENLLEYAGSGLTDADVVAGNAESLGPLINKARKFWSKASKTQKIDDAIEAAESYRYGVSNGIKWQFRNILKSPKKSRGFTEAEKALMKRVIRGTIPEKLLEYAGSGLTTIGGIGLGAAGAATGGIPGAIGGALLTGASMAAREASNAITRRNADVVRSLIASGASQSLPTSANPMIRSTVERLLRQATAAGVQRYSTQPR